MKLDYLMTYHADLKPMQDIGKGPFGTRRIAEVSGGTLEGPDIKGSILTCGGDWILIDDAGYGRLDVRTTFATDDSANIYVQYYGVLEFNEKVITALTAGSETQYGDTYFMAQPRFETGDPRYQWLVNTVAVAEGRGLRRVDCNDARARGLFLRKPKSEHAVFQISTDVVCVDGFGQGKRA